MYGSLIFAARRNETCCAYCTKIFNKKIIQKVYISCIINEVYQLHILVD